MNNRICNLANFVTSLRIIGAFIVIFLEPFSAAFYIVYTVCGLSDGIDGTIARKCNTSCKFGARLDSVSDLLFYTVMIIKVFPYLIRILPAWIWWLCLVIIVIRVSIYIYVAVKHRCFASIHTYMNKVVGALAFLIPYMMLLDCRIILIAGIAILAFLSAIEELLIHVSTNTYQENTRTIFKVNK